MSEHEVHEEWEKRRQTAASLIGTPFGMAVMAGVFVSIAGTVSYAVAQTGAWVVGFIVIAGVGGFCGLAATWEARSRRRSEQLAAASAASLSWPRPPLDEAGDQLQSPRRRVEPGPSEDSGRGVVPDHLDPPEQPRWGLEWRDDYEQDDRDPYRDY